MEMPKEKTATGDENLGLVGPDSFLFGTIPYYQGDMVRQLLISAAALIIVVVPVVSTESLVALAFFIAGALGLAGCAAITSPRKVTPLYLDAIVSAVGIIIFETMALTAYRTNDLVLFVVYEALALIFLFALYFSVKSIRGMTLRKRVVASHATGKRRIDGEEYVDPPIAIIPSQKDPLRHDSRPGDLRRHGYFDD